MKKRSLILVAGCVWLAAGGNVARIGLQLYPNFVTALNIVLSAVVFCLFGLMFFKMSRKHVRRISAMEDKKHCFLRFFDLKSYIIMICMMTFGIALRYSGWVPLEFIAFFYTGLGAALALAGVVFIVEFARYEQKSDALAG